MILRKMISSAALGCIAAGLLAPPTAFAESPIGDRIVRIVYDIVFDGPGPRGANWGFHLAQMKDGRYCVRLGNPGRLNLAIIQKAADICFDRIPGTVDQSSVSTSQAFDTREKGKRILVSSYHKGSIETAGNEITLNITTCNKEGGNDYRCFPKRFVVHMNGPDCSAQVTLGGTTDRAGRTTCEHYAAR